MCNLATTVSIIVTNCKLKDGLPNKYQQHTNTIDLLNPGHKTSNKIQIYVARKYVLLVCLLMCFLIT